MQKFLIIGNSRTGTTLLQNLVGSHPHALAGGELFHPKKIANGTLSWPVAALRKDPRIAGARSGDARPFVDALFRQSAGAPIRAMGFKALYYQLDARNDLREMVAGDPEWKVIHIKRRNLVRRFLSVLRARTTGVYNVSARQGVPDRAKPGPLPVDLLECLQDVEQAEREEAAMDALFAANETCEVVYEKLSDDPAGEGNRVVAFLGLDPAYELEARVAQIGGDPLEEEIEDHAELCSRLERWIEMFRS